MRGRDKGVPGDGEFVVDVKNHLPKRLRTVFRANQIVKFVYEEGKKHRDFETEAQAAFRQAMMSLDEAKTKKKQIDKIFKNAWK